MNKRICIITLFLICRICNAQNLISNPSFEDTVQCPDHLDQVNRAVGWYSTRPSPDYYNTCASPSTVIPVSVPYNYFGYQYPSTGNAYVGFCAKDDWFNIKECIGTQLISPLQIGIRYFVSFKLSLSYTNFGIACGVNKLGMLFSTVQYTTANNPAPVCNCSQFYTDSIVVDTVNWIQIKGSFIADSNYIYVNIGNFFEDSLIDSIQVQGSQCVSYYYIDDVCVSPDSLTCYSSVGINEIKNEEDLVLFPNPFTDRINITVNKNEIVEVNIYDITSRKLLSQSFTNSTSINTEQLANGIYIYELRNSKHRIANGKIIKN